MPEMFATNEQLVTGPPVAVEAEFAASLAKLFAPPQEVLDEFTARLDQWLAKFNPNHDPETGEFTTGDGGGAIEVNESFGVNGRLEATTSGGQQTVTIVEHPAQTIRELYNPSAGAARSAGSSRMKTVKLPQRYEVIHDRGSTFTRDYSHAVRLAVHHAGRKPKVAKYNPFHDPETGEFSSGGGGGGGGGTETTSVGGVGNTVTVPALVNSLKDFAARSAGTLRERVVTLKDGKVLADYVQELQTNPDLTANELKPGSTFSNADMFDPTTGESHAQGSIVDLHTHPRDETLSDGDWRVFARSTINEMHAVSEATDYSITKTPKYWAMPWTERTPAAIDVVHQKNLLDAEKDLGYDAPDFVNRIFHEANIRTAAHFGVDYKATKLHKSGPPAEVIAEFAASLAKYNMEHDELGRFTFAPEGLGGGGSLSRGSLSLRGTKGKDNTRGDNKDAKTSKQFLDHIYSTWPVNPMNPREVYVEAGGGAALFDLSTSVQTDGGVHIGWMQAVPQGKGIGTAAMQKLVDEADLMKVPLDLTIWDKGKKAALKRFYESFGFEKHNYGIYIRQPKATKYNPYHVPAGVPEGGEFTSEGEAGGQGMSVAPSDRSTWPQYIQDLKVPPAWSNVMIASDPNADLLVVGRDAKGRGQYIYSDRFAQGQAEAKFERIRELQDKSGEIAAQNNANLQSGDPSLAEHAEVANLIMQTGLRPGSEKDTGAEKQAYGATTLLGQHVKVGTDGQVTLEFTGKKGVDLSIPVPASLAPSLIARAEAAGPDGKLFPLVDNRSLSEYVGTLDGGNFKTKDFRTALGTSTARAAMATIATPKTLTAYKKAVREVAKIVSSKLGNTPTVALQSYIDPTTFSEWRHAAHV